MKLFRKLAILAVFGATLLTSCASSSPTVNGNGPYRTVPDNRPEWVPRPSAGGSDTVLAFRGISGRYASEQVAQNDAQDNGREQLVEFYGTSVKSLMQQVTGTYGLVSETLNPQIAEAEFGKQVAENLAQALYPVEYYTEVYLDDNNKDAFVVYALMTVQKNIANKVIDDYGKQQAEQLRTAAQAATDAEQKKQIEEVSRIFDNLPERMQSFFGD
jgi:hypothetical protein